MEMDVEERLEALLHYSKVFVLEYSIETWLTRAARKTEVLSSMRTVDLDWLDADDDRRPSASADMQDMSVCVCQGIRAHSDYTQYG
jgi:hypothetical protein